MEFPPPSDMSMPPPSFQGGGGGPGGYQPRPSFHNNFHHKPFYKGHYKHGMQVQDDFDGKRLRKTVMRKTVDYNSSIVKALEVSFAIRALLYEDLNLDNSTESHMAT